MPIKNMKTTKGNCQARRGKLNIGYYTAMLPGLLTKSHHKEAVAASVPLPLLASQHSARVYFSELPLLDPFLEY